MLSDHRQAVKFPERFTLAPEQVRLTRVAGTWSASRLMNALRSLWASH